MDATLNRISLNPDLQSRIEKVKEILAAEKSVLVAFSGGADSSLLLALAREALGGKAAAGTVDSPLLPRHERREACIFTKNRNIAHYLIQSDEVDLAEFAENSQNRCYICKGLHMRALLDLARKRGLARVAHGANASDQNDYRPGLTAARELAILAPLAEAGLDKDAVRQASRAMGLETWDKASMACLASRIPYGDRITREKLAAVEMAEDFLRDSGFAQFRVRHHGTVARIEICEEDFERLLTRDLREALVRRLEGLGFSYASLDLAGYKTGNLNKGIS